MFDIPTPRKVLLIFIPESTDWLPELKSVHAPLENLKNSQSALFLHAASHAFAVVIVPDGFGNCVAVA
jgi:hypothetical protein